MLAKRTMSGSYGWDKSAQNNIDMYHKMIAKANPETASAAAAVGEADVLNADEAPAKHKTTRKPRAK